MQKSQCYCNDIFKYTNIYYSIINNFVLSKLSKKSKRKKVKLCNYLFWILTLENEDKFYAKNI